MRYFKVDTVVICHRSNERQFHTAGSVTSAVLMYKVLHSCAPSYLGRSLMLPTFRVAEDFFAVLAATA